MSDAKNNPELAVCVALEALVHALETRFGDAMTDEVYDQIRLLETAILLLFHRNCSHATTMLAGIKELKGQRDAVQRSVIRLKDLLSSYSGSSTPEN